MKDSIAEDFRHQPLFVEGAELNHCAGTECGQKPIAMCVISGHS